MTAIRPGSLVLCKPRRGYSSGHCMTPEHIRRAGTMPTEGVVYTVRTINEWPRATLITLVEIDNSHVLRAFGPEAGKIEPGFDLAHFIPLDDSALDVFRAHLTDTPAKEPVAP